MQVNVLDQDNIIIFDKQEANPLKVNGESVWGSVYTISTQAVRALVMETNSFCAGGGWLGNGTLVSVGGTGDSATSATGWNGLRLYTPTANGTDQVVESPNRLKLTSDRWYPSTTRLEDGSIIILGGMTTTGFNNAEDTDNPTLEFWPPKGTGLAVYSTFLHDALNTNLFPVTFLLPSGDIFVAASTLAMTYNWKTGEHKHATRRSLPVPSPLTTSCLLAAVRSQRDSAPFAPERRRDQLPRHRSLSPPPAHYRQQLDRRSPPLRWH